MGGDLAKYCQSEAVSKLKGLKLYFNTDNLQKDVPASYFTNSFWERLPYLALVKIYQYLPDQDKFNLSLTCRAWSLPFYRTEIWEQGKFLFDGIEDWRALIFVSSYASGLRHLVIDCLGDGEISSDEKNQESVSYLYTFLNSLLNCKNHRLVTLKLINLNRISKWFQWYRKHAKYDIMRVIKDLLSIQTTLKLLDLSDAFIDVDKGLDLLSRLAHTSGSTITSLALKSFVFNKEPICIATQMRAFTQLQELTLSSDYLSDALLDALADSESLKRIIVLADSKIEFSPPSSQSWEHLTRSRPALEAGYFITTCFQRLGRLEVLKSILTPGMPLVALKISWFDTCHSWKFLCHHIATHFQNHLRRLEITICQDMVCGDHLLDVIIERCLLLEVIYITNRGENSSFHESIDRSVRRALAQQPASRLRRVTSVGEDVNLDLTWGRRLVDWIIGITE